MKLRSTWPAAFVVTLVGCGSGSIGAGFNGSGNGGGSGSVGGSGTSVQPPPQCANNACMQVDGGYVTADGGFIPSSGSTAGSGGVAGTGNGGGSGTATGGGACTPGKAVGANPGAAPTTTLTAQTVTKLTATEYANTVSDLLGVSQAQQTVPLSADTSAGGFSVGGASTDATAQAYHDSALQIAGVATSTANIAGLLTKYGSCAAPAANSGTAGATCATAFIAAFAQNAFRHGAPDAATLSGLGNVYTAVSAVSGFSGGVAAVIEEVLQSPYFLYHLETEQQAMGVTAQPITVTGYSMANRLSYLLWSSMPDATLFTAAAGGMLSTTAQVQAQAQRMLTDTTGAPTAKARTGLQNFYQQWLTEPFFPNSKLGNSTQITTGGTLSTTSLFNNGTPTGESYATLFSTANQQSIIASFNMEVEDALWSPTGAIKTLLTSTKAYANAGIAPLFGATATGTTLQAITLDGTKRLGILSHPLLMAAYATNATSHPIKRGRFVWDQIVCQPLPNPPPGVPAFTPPKAGMGLREDFEVLTATGPYAGKMSADPAIPCPSCHERIDPIGFLFEPYDTIGNYRTIDDYGVNVDMTNITVVGATDSCLNVAMTSSMQLANMLATSDLPNQCLTQMLYRYMVRRNDGTADYAVEQWLDDVFDSNNQNVASVLVALTQTNAFFQRMNGQ